MENHKTTFFESYGALAEHIDNDIIISGRNNFQKNSITAIVEDVSAKLLPKKTDHLLEIGCNIGLLLNPLSRMVKTATGIDHPSLIAKLQNRLPNDTTTLIGGEWPNIDLNQQYDCILVYSVLHCLPDRDISLRFIEAAMNTLAPGGRLLLGDLPNEDMRQRFMASPTGHKVAQDYNKQRDADAKNTDMQIQYEARNAVWPQNIDVFVDDNYVLDILKQARSKGLDAFVYPQPETLPFGYSREDILISKRD